MTRRKLHVQKTCEHKKSFEVTPSQQAMAKCMQSFSTVQPKRNSTLAQYCTHSLNTHDTVQLHRIMMHADAP